MKNIGATVVKVLINTPNAVEDMVFFSKECLIEFPRLAMIFPPNLQSIRNVRSVPFHDKDFYNCLSYVLAGTFVRNAGNRHCPCVLPDHDYVPA